MSLHISRHWGRDECPCKCGRAECGMVDYDRIDPECIQHPMERGKTIRASHLSVDCPEVLTA